MKKVVEVLTSKRKQGAYLYKEKLKPLNTLPQALLEQLGQLKSVMTIVVTEDKNFAHVDGKKLLDAIAQNGFYLQYTPEEQEAYMQKIPNSKLPKA